MRKFYIMPALAADAMESWIWTDDSEIPENCFIIIKNPLNSKRIKTFKRTIDGNFIKTYNQSEFTNDIKTNNNVNYLILNEYYRKSLHLGKNDVVELQISKASLLQKIIIIHWLHPNPTVQYANRATITSIIIGIIALLITVYSISFS